MGIHYLNVIVSQSLMPALYGNSANAASSNSSLIFKMKIPSLFKIPYSGLLLGLFAIPALHNFSLICLGYDDELPGKVHFMKCIFCMKIDSVQTVI